MTVGCKVLWLAATQSGSSTPSEERPVSGPRQTAVRSRSQQRVMNRPGYGPIVIGAGGTVSVAFVVAASTLPRTDQFPLSSTTRRAK
jgi:hypothetical protein